MPSIGDYIRILKHRITGEEIPQNKISAFVALQKAAANAVELPGSRTTLALVIPCFGHARYLVPLFESIISQTRFPDQVIFVEDASPDDTAVILEKLISGQAEDIRQRFLLIRNARNAGQAASLNLAISAAECDLIMILNDDDYLLHDAVQAMLNLFRSYPQVVLIGGHSLHFSGDHNLSEIPKMISEHVAADKLFLDVRNPEDVLFYRKYNDLNVTHSGCCFLKSAWSAVGGYISDKARRIVPFSDRDFQLRVNALYPVGTSSTIPFACWRSDSSVDAGRDT